MKKFYIYFFILFLFNPFLTTISEAQTPCDSQFDKCSKNGYSFPSTGTYRMLTLFINIHYESDTLDPYGDTQLEPEWWQPGAPNSINDNVPHDMLLNLLDTSQTQQNFPHGTMTRIIHESSLGNLTLLSDFMVINITQEYINYLRDSTQTTVLPHAIFDRTHLMNAVYDLINENGGIDGVYDYNQLSDYDNFTPGSTLEEHPQVPNGKIDFIQGICRNCTGAYGSVTSGSGYGGITGSPGIYFPDVDDTVLPDRGSFQGCNHTDTWVLNPTRIHIHEFAHSLFGLNNMHTTGGAHYGTITGHTFLSLQGGHGLMGASGSGLVSVNAYERWRLGWVNTSDNPTMIPIAALDTNQTLLNSDVDKSMGKQSFILRDFVTYGDVIRIKLPYKDDNALNQYIWLENHKIGSNNKLDFLQWSNTYECRPDGKDGIYMYYQIGKDVLEGNSSSDITPGNEADNIKVISAEGYWDYELITDSEPISCVAWGNAEQTERILPNPLSGLQDQEQQFKDISNDEITIDDKFSSHSICFDDGGMTCDSNIPYVGDNRDAFNGNNYISISTNPSPVTRKTYYHRSPSTSSSEISQVTESKNNNTIYLSGLRIEMTELSGGDYRVDLAWDDYDVTEEVRWTGTIALNEEIHVKENNGGITLTQNYSPDQHVRDDTSGVFSRVSEFTANENSYIKLEENTFFEINEKSRLILKNESKLDMLSNSLMTIKEESRAIIESGAEITLDNAHITLKTQSELILKSGSKLEMLEGSTLYIHPTAKLIIEDDAELIMHDDTELLIDGDFSGNGELVIENTTPGKGLIVGVGSNDYEARVIQSGTLTLPENEDFVHDNAGYFVIQSNDINLSENAEIIFTGQGVNLTQGTGHKTLVVSTDWIVENDITISDSYVELNNKMSCFENAVDFEDIVFESNHSHGHIELDNTELASITNVGFFNLGTLQHPDPALFIKNVTQSPVNVTLSGFVDCKIAIKAENSDEINFDNIEIVTTGMTAENTGMILDNIDIINIDDSEIHNLEYGITATDVNGLYLDNSKVYENEYGIHAEHSLLFLRNQAEVYDNEQIGIEIEGTYDSNEDEFTAMLTIGDVGCGWVYDHGTTAIAMKGIDALLNIDQIEHHGSFSPIPNRFDNDGKVFEFCYWGASAPSEVLAKGNYWGDNQSHPDDYEIVSGNCDTWFQVVPIPLNSDDHQSCTPDCSHCGLPDPCPIWGCFSFSSADSVIIQEFNQTNTQFIEEDSKQTRSSFNDIAALGLRLDTINDELQWKVISIQDQEYSINEVTAHFIMVSKVLGKSSQRKSSQRDILEDVKEASSEVEHLEEGKILVYPNPATEHLNFELNANSEKYRISMYNMLGMKLFDKQVSGTNYVLDVKQINTQELVFIKIYNSDNELIFTEKIQLMK